MQRKSCRAAVFLCRRMVHCHGAPDRGLKIFALFLLALPFFLVYTTFHRVKVSPILRGRSSAGRAPAWHAGGQGFDPPRLHHENETPQTLFHRVCGVFCCTYVFVPLPAPLTLFFSREERAGEGEGGEVVGEGFGAADELYGAVLFEKKLSASQFAVVVEAHCVTVGAGIKDD